mgnify:CR=1 FL=1
MKRSSGEETPEHRIPADAIPIRDFMMSMGESEESLREFDRVSKLRQEILEKEPWRNKTKWVRVGEDIGYFKGEIDWSGTEMQEYLEQSKTRERFAWETLGWEGLEWVVTGHDSK